MFLTSTKNMHFTWDVAQIEKIIPLSCKEIIVKLNILRLKIGVGFLETSRQLKFLTICKEKPR